MVAALRRVPGLHGVRDGVPVRGAVRQADRGDAGPGRAPAPRGRWPTGCCASAIFALFPHPRRLRLLRGPLRLYQRTGLQRVVRRSGVLAAALAHAGGDGGARAAARAGAARARSASPARGRAARRSVGMLTGCVQRRVLPRRQRRDGPGAGGGGLRRGRPPRPGLLRRAVGAQRPRGRGASASPAAPIDTFDARRRRRTSWSTRPGCGSSMKEYADLLARRPGLRRAGRGASPANVRDVSEFLDELGPVAARHPLPVTGRLPRRLPPRRTPRGSAPSRASCCAASPGWSCARSPRPTSAAARPASTTCCNPEPARELGDRKAGRRARHRRRRCWSPPTPAA